MQFKLIALLTLVVASVNGAAIHKRFSGTCDCGGTQYDNEAITDAFDQSKKGSFGLIRKYPHGFNNREKFSFPGCTAGTLQEFPILKSGLFDSDLKQPGPDRVIFDTAGTICGCITHTNAPKKNGFVQCT